MNSNLEDQFSFDWHKDFYTRCTQGANWVDFSFDLGGGEKDLPLERLPTRISERASPEFVAAVRTALTIHLQKLGYRVI